MIGADIRMIGARLKEERERLGYTQPVFAELAGAKKRTLIDWEKGVSSPTAVQLAEFSKIGVDVLYVLTGDRRATHVVQQTALSPRQAALLDNYEHTDEAGKKIIEAAAFAAAQPKTAQGSKR